MIATAAFVLAFLVIGSSVVFLALGGGPKGARENLHRQGRGGSRFAITLTLVIVVAFGVGIPIAVIAANSDNQSKQSIGGVKLTASEENGRRVFAKNCSTCHTLSAANAVGKVGPNLDQLRPVAALTLDAIKNGRARGQGQMPAGLIDGQDAKHVAAFLAAAAGRNN